MSVENIVNINITRQSQNVTRTGFGLIAILGDHDLNLDRYRIYSDLDEMVDDGFEAADEEYKAASAVFSQDPSVTEILVARKDNYEDPETWVEAIQGLREVNDDWYGLIATTHSESDQLDIATYIETTKKIYGTSSSDADILDVGDTDDIASQLEALEFSRTFVMYHATPASYPEAAWMGRQFPKDPGSSTWKFKTLVGITASTLTPTQQSVAEGKNCNVYTEVGGVNITSEGVMASGEFIDVIHGLDWLEITMEEDVFAFLVSQEKVPYTDGGISGIESIIKNRLTIAVQNNVLASDPPPETSVPRATAVPSSDRAARELNQVTFTGRLSGAIHALTVEGTVTV
jgi:hypothetical protein